MVVGAPRRGGAVKLEHLTEGAYYSMQGQKLELVRKGIPYGPSGKPWGVEVRDAAGKLRELRAQDLDSAWTREHERRWLATRRRA
jgi:hypothetical protein